MPKVHQIGERRFVQFAKLPLEWGSKLVVRGWTQEIEEPYRVSEPFLVRLPRGNVLVLGKWTGNVEEEEALNSALQTREVTYEDFSEEAGWTPAPDSNREAGVDAVDPGPGELGGDIPVLSGKEPARVEPQ